MGIINYTYNTASERDIFEHLKECAANFTPPLTERIDVALYAKKLAEKAINFEAWQKDSLVGLIAAYVNPTEQTAFITNVSVEKNLMGQGVAAALMNECIEQLKKKGVVRIGLEVNGNSTQAVRFYQKFFFYTERSEGESLFMNLELANQTK